MKMSLRFVVISFLRDPGHNYTFFNPDGFTYEETVKKYFSIADESEFETLLSSCGKNVERTLLNGYKVVRATFGHAGPLLFMINYGKFVPYDGPYETFCLSHVTTSGLGILSTNRKVNVLNVPDRCENKGVKAFVNVKSSGLLFWLQVGDRYRNKVFCFDPKLNEHFYKLEYVDDYNSPERIKKFQSTAVQNLMTLNKYSEEEAVKHIQKLFIIVGDEDEDEEVLSDYDVSSELKLERVLL